MKLFGLQFAASVETSPKYFHFSFYLFFNKLQQGYLFSGQEKPLAQGLVALNKQWKKK
jgi:hypothetical protein